MPSECCRHIRTTGRRCNSPALRGKAFCFYHDRSRTRHRPSQPVAVETVLHPLRPHFAEPDALGQAEPTLAAPRPEPLTFDFPPLEDRESIQVAASMIVAALGRNQLDGKRAATMLYGLQVASAVTRFDIHPDDDCMMQVETFDTPEGSDLSADEDPEAECDAARDAEVSSGAPA